MHQHILRRSGYKLRNWICCLTLSSHLWNIYVVTCLSQQQWKELKLWYLNAASRGKLGFHVRVFNASLGFSLSWPQTPLLVSNRRVPEVRLPLPASHQCWHSCRIKCPANDNRDSRQLPASPYDPLDRREPGRLQFYGNIPNFLLSILHAKCKHC